MSQVKWAFVFISIHVSHFGMLSQFLFFFPVYFYSVVLFFCLFSALTILYSKDIAAWSVEHKT